MVHKSFCKCRISGINIRMLDMLEARKDRLNKKKLVCKPEEVSRINRRILIAEVEIIRLNREIAKTQPISAY